LDAGIWLNGGLLFYLSGDSASAKSAFGRGLAMCGGYEAASRLMGVLPDDEGNARQAPRRMALEEVRRLLRSLLPAPPTRAAQKPANSEVVLPTTRPIVQQLGDRAQFLRQRIGSTRSGQPNEMYRFFYWRPSQ